LLQSLKQVREEPPLRGGAVARGDPKLGGVVGHASTKKLDRWEESDERFEGVVGLGALGGWSAEAPRSAPPRRIGDPVGVYLRS
jgi:hypothetical protein